MWSNRRIFLVRTFKDNQTRLQFFLGLQPVELPESSRPSTYRGAQVADNATGEACQDWRQCDTELEICDVTTRRSGGDLELVRKDPQAHRTVGVATADRRWMPRIGALVGQNN